MGSAKGETVGMAIYFQNYSTYLARPGLYIEDLFVLPEWRDLGLGEELLGRLATIAIEREYGRLEWSVLGWNKSAINFYCNHGAEMIDESKLCRVTGPALEALAKPITIVKGGS